MIQIILYTDSESFKAKVKITRETNDDGNTKKIEIIVPLKYLSNFWRNLEMPLISCEINVIITCPSTCVIANSISAGNVQNGYKNLCAGYNFIKSS